MTRFEPLALRQPLCELCHAAAQFQIFISSLLGVVGVEVPTLRYVK